MSEQRYVRTTLCGKAEESGGEKRRRSHRFLNSFKECCRKTEPLHLVVRKQDKSLTYLGTVVIHAGQDVVHEVKPPSGLVGKYEACMHDRDICMLNLQRWSKRYQ